MQAHEGLKKPLENKKGQDKDKDKDISKVKDNSSNIDKTPKIDRKVPDFGPIVNSSKAKKSKTPPPSENAKKDKAELNKNEAVRQAKVFLG